MVKLRDHEGEAVSEEREKGRLRERGEGGKGEGRENPDGFGGRGMGRRSYIY